MFPIATSLVPPMKCQLNGFWRITPIAGSRRFSATLWVYLDIGTGLRQRSVVSVQTVSGGRCLAREPSGATSGAADETTDSLPEVSVDSAVENEVHGKVDRLQQVKGRQGQIVDVRCFTRRDVLEKVEDLGWNEEQDVHDDDDDQRQRDPIGRLTVVPRRVALHAHAHRPAQGENQMRVAEDENKKRDEDSDGEVEPHVDRFDGLVLHHRSFDGEVNDGTVLTFEAEQCLPEVARNVEESTGDEDDSERRQGKCLSNELFALERIADCEESTERHADRQPRACQNERVDDRRTVDEIDQPEVEVRIAEASGSDIGAWQNGDTYQHIGYSETNKSVVSGLFHALHGVRQTLLTEHEKVEQVAYETKHSYDEHDLCVDDLLNRC